MPGARAARFFLFLLFFAAISCPDGRLAHGQAVASSSTHGGNGRFAEDEIDLLKRMAREGNIQAQHRLGLMYWRGQEVEKNVQEAIYWLRHAAEHGYAEAQYNLGRVYAQGNSLEDALHWYLKAARRGYLAAQLQAARLYAVGEGIPRNYVEAYRWWLIAARQGDPTSKKNLDRLGKMMDPVDIGLAEEAADRPLLLDETDDMDLPMDHEGRDPSIRRR